MVISPCGSMPPIELERLRLLRSRAVNLLWEEREIGVAHHQVDVFLVDATARISADSAASINARSTSLSAAQPIAARCRFCDSTTNSFSMRTHFGRNESRILYDRDPPEAGRVVP